MAQDPATIRYFNPGGQYPGPSARRFGSNATEIIGGGHQIAVFPDAESGGAAQFDLLSRGYSNMRLADALRKWSGGNSADAYTANITRQTGLAPDTVITPELLRSPQGIALVRAMAQHETGRPYPMTDDQWRAAQTRAFGGVATTQPEAVQTQPPPPSPTPQPPPETPPAGNFDGLSDERRLEVIRAALEGQNRAGRDPLADTQLDTFGRLSGATPSVTDDSIPMPQAPQMRRVDLNRLRASLQNRRLGRV